MNGTRDYGDYDGEYEVCACGALIVEPDAKTCKSCARRADAQRREVAYQQRKLARHHIRMFWLTPPPEPDPFVVFALQFGCERYREVIAAVRAA